MNFIGLVIGVICWVLLARVVNNTPAKIGCAIAIAAMGAVYLRARFKESERQ